MQSKQQQARIEYLNQQWKSIDSAPKGKDVLVYCEDTREMIVAFWSEYDKAWQFAYYEPEDVMIHCKPSHWTELPGSPK